MRRPQQESLQEDNHQRHHNHHHHHHHHPSSSASLEPCQRNEKDGSRLARVKRVLTGSLLNRTGNTRNYNRVFGARLELVESYLDTGVPYVVHRLCNYIEKYGFQNATLFQLSAGSPKLTGKLRAAFERKGDADLEEVACPSTAATLLRQYLKELPQPLVPSSLVARLLYIHSQDYDNHRETWIEQTRQLLLSLPPSHYRLLGYLANHLSKYEAQHGRSSGVCGVFAPVVLPYVPPATTLLRDILIEASKLFPTCNKDSSTYIPVIPNDCEICCKERKIRSCNTNNHKNLLCALKPRKRKEWREFCSQERKLIRSNSEEQILENSINLPKSIRRVNSHEDFSSDKHFHIISRVGQEMGHGVRCSNLPLYERTNVSPGSTKSSPLLSPCDILLNVENPENDVERARNTERFSRSITPRGRRLPRRKSIHKSLETDVNSSKENKNEETGSNLLIDLSASNCRNNSNGQSFLEMLSSGPSRTPSPVRPPLFDHEDSNNPVPTNWNPLRTNNKKKKESPEEEKEEVEEEIINERVEALTSPRNSLLVPRRFYTENDVPPSVPAPLELGLKTLTKQINGLKKKIKKYEDEFEESFGYRPSHSDRMSNRDIKKLCTELNKLRKEHKMLKEDPISLLRATANTRTNSLDNSVGQNNVNSSEKSRTLLIEEMLKEIEKKLSEKKLKYGRPDNAEDMTYEQLLDEKTAVQKALLHIESTFGRPVIKEDRDIVRVLYDRYRTLKRLLIRAGSNKNKDSISELATILEHEAMDFTSSSLPANPIDADRRASEPDMSHRGILDCIDASDQLLTDSDSQHSSSESSRGPGENLHELPQEDLIAQQRVIREEKKRLRRALKELEIQFEVRAGRKMQKEDRGPHVMTVYEFYKQTKAKLRLIDALLSKNS